MQEKQEDKNKSKQDNPNGNKVKHSKANLPTEIRHLFSLSQPCIIIDCHMHIESGRCAPMPSLLDKLPGVKLIWKGVNIKRSTIENISKIINYSTSTAVTVVGGIVVPEIRPFLTSISKFAGDTAQKKFESSGLGKFNALGKMSTLAIGEIFIKQKYKEAFSYFQTLAEYKDCHLVFSVVLMPMDMEYAHVDGYFGIKIYNGIYDKADEKMENPTDYWYPHHGLLHRKGVDFEEINSEDLAKDIIPHREKSGESFESAKQRIEADEGVVKHYVGEEKVGLVKIKFTPRLLDREETKLYEIWDKQVKSTELTMLANPLKILSLWHYDPRRWQEKGNSKPFEKVGEKNGLYLGFKMYTAQGYRPWEPRLPIMKEFYKKCHREQIPIMNHCSPDGMYSYDRMEYLRFRHPLDDEKLDNSQKEDYMFKMRPPVHAGENYGYPVVEQVEDAKGYFNRHFVSPEAWLEVLKKWPNLRLCLAHFGGNKKLGREWGMKIIEMIKTYPNLYADISSSFANKSSLLNWKDFRNFFMDTIKENPELKSRILFGTDWYMTVQDNMEYLAFCKETKEFLDSFDISLWVRFTLINPISFYQLDKQIERIAKNIIKKRKTEEIQNKWGPLEKSKIDLILKEAAFIKQTCEIYRDETP